MQLTILFTLGLASLSTAQTVYLIRHGEKPDDGDGLSAEGVERSQCLRNVFASSTPYDIQYIMAQTPQSDGSQQRPYDTILPLSQDLGITPDISCQRDDQDCVADVVSNYDGSGNILICWEHDALTDIVHALGASKKNSPDYPDDSFNIIWTDPPPYSGIASSTSENCPGLDTSSKKRAVPYSG